LNQWHTDTRSLIKSAYGALEKTEEQLQDAVEFSERLLQHGSAHMLPLRQIVLKRLYALSSALPFLIQSMKCQNGIEFVSDGSNFSAVVQSSGGHFTRADNVGEVTCCKKTDSSFGGDSETLAEIDTSGVHKTQMSKVCD